MSAKDNNTTKSDLVYNEEQTKKKVINFFFNFNLASKSNMYLQLK